MSAHASPTGEQGSAAPRRVATAAALVLAVVGLLGAGTMAAPSEAQTSGGRASCFWFPVFDREHNFAYPDFSARYWAARFSPPPGSRLLLEGRFPRARYMSLNAYRGAEPIDTITDTEVEPLHGDTNPFVEGSRRDIGRRGRRWNLRVSDRPAPEEPAPRRDNTLYAAASAGVQTLAYRVYVPDKGRGIKAGGGLPLPVLIGADGSRLGSPDFSESPKTMASATKRMTGNAISRFGPRRAVAPSASPLGAAFSLFDWSDVTTSSWSLLCHHRKISAHLIAQHGRRRDGPDDQRYQRYGRQHQQW